MGFLILVFLLYEVTTGLLLRTVEQESTAMEPTLEAGDRVFMSPLVYGPRLPLFDLTLPGFRQPAHGELAVITPGYTPELGPAARIVDPLYRFVTLQNRRMNDGTGWNSSLQIKRIIGLPGDTLRMERFVAYVRPAGATEFVSEFALTGGEYELIVDERPGAWEPLDPLGAATEELTLGENEYFVLSDNRSSGTDSRHWGVITADRIHGNVGLRFWPFSRFGSP